MKLSEKNSRIKKENDAGRTGFPLQCQQAVHIEIGNEAEKESVCSECRKMGITDAQMNWPE